MSSKKPPGDSLLAVGRGGLEGGGWGGGDEGGSHALILASMLSGWITHPHAMLSMSEPYTIIA